MIVFEDGRYAQNSKFPDRDWYNEGNYVVDETKEENQWLIKKIEENAPYMELVVEDGELVDVTPTERPPEPTPEPTQIEWLELNMYEAIAEVYEEKLTSQLDTYEAIAEMYETFFAGGEM